MYKKSPQGWLKHWDFILLDIFCLQLAFVVAYLVRQGLENPYSDQIYRTVAFVFMLCQIVVMFLGQSYQDILKRGYYIEFTKTAKHVLMVMLLSVLYLFATQQAVSYSRLTLFYVIPMCCLLVFEVWLWTELHISTHLNIFWINALLCVAIILSSFKSLKFEGNFYNCGDDCRLTNRLQKNGRGKKKIYV